MRLQSENIVEDVFGAGQGVKPYLDLLEKEGRGIVVYLREGSAGVGQSSDSRLPCWMAQKTMTRHAIVKMNGEKLALGAQILKDLGVNLSSYLHHKSGTMWFGRVWHKNHLN